MKREKINLNAVSGGNLNVEIGDLYAREGVNILSESHEDRKTSMYTYDIKVGN